VGVISGGCPSKRVQGRGDGWLLAAAAHLHRARDARADGAGGGRGGLDGLARAHRAAHGRRAGDGGRGDANHLSS